MLRTHTPIGFVDVVESEAGSLFLLLLGSIMNLFIFLTIFIFLLHCLHCHIALVFLFCLLTNDLAVVNDSNHYLVWGGDLLSALSA